MNSKSKEMDFFISLIFKEGQKIKFIFYSPAIRMLVSKKWLERKKFENNLIKIGVREYDLLIFVSEGSRD